MSELLRIEFLIQKNYIKSLVISIIVILCSFTLSNSINNIQFMAIFFTFYFIIVSIEIEKRNKFNIYLNSLPIKKEEYILSKYLSSIIYIILTNILFLIISLFLNFIFNRTMFTCFSNIITTLSIQFLYASIILPVFININYKYTKFFNVAFSVITVIFLMEMQVKTILFINNFKFLIFSIIVFLISSIISIFIFKRRDV
ncbi:ABC-2 transporter permease [Clostridium sp. Ade.TY]|uniref:ABC-2 transporter permease n=1 Tax=Clostridium sp. Ade.TY TaxID=1391647 RepID=UPI000421F699|nr:ABC-2 transporter permease [Clostridium sp. Ade.TY]